jgi:hypothetical protein
LDARLTRPPRKNRWKRIDQILVDVKDRAYGVYQQADEIRTNPSEEYARLTACLADTEPQQRAQVEERD